MFKEQLFSKNEAKLKEQLRIQEETKFKEKQNKSQDGIEEDENKTWKIQIIN